ncbi:hypothetical protein [Georgenia halophila]|uniref:hypothetical protein n=1 Tax=Georgenia halophila TaxID=620889 RepID=UPI0031F16C29
MASSTSLSLLPSRTPVTGYATIGLDLTGLGVPADSFADGADLPVEKADVARIASYTRAAHTSGVSFVALGESFRLRSDRAVRHDDWLDPVVAARRIAPHACAGIVPCVPAGADLDLVEGALAEASRQQGAWAGLQLTGADAARAATPRRSTRSQRGPRPRVVLPVASEEDVELAGRYADVVRIRETDVEWARELRYAVRAAARAAGREGAVRVVADLHTVVSADRESAQERAGLITDIAGEAVTWAGALAAYGTAGDVADVIQSWTDGGAADGFVVLPGSLPADVAALVRGIVPELRARGILEDRPGGPASAPLARSAAGSTTAIAQADRRRAVAVA